MFSIRPTFTLAPAARDQAQPQLQGVSPGHGGVDGAKGTEMSNITRQKVETSSVRRSSTRIVSSVRKGSPYRRRISAP